MDLRKAMSKQTDNSLKLAEKLLSEPSNVVFSPLSIHVLLSMIAAGSNDPTRHQIVSFITSTPSDELTTFFSQILSPVIADGSPRGGPVLSSANGLWVDLSLTFKPAFRHVLEKLYGAACQHADFQHKPKEVIDQVNKWASKQTNGLIKDILPPDAVDPLFTRLILANALYFNGSWNLRHKFHAELTKKQDFYLLDGTSVQAPLMSSNNSMHCFRAFEGFKVLRLPYQQGRDTRSFSMYIFLPDARDGLPALRERVCSESGFINHHLPSDTTMSPLDKYLVPKFKFDFTFEATDVLKKMGLVLPFEDGQLTEMVNPMFPMEDSRMFHKALIEVNEEGTKASSCPAFLVGGGGPVYRPEFVADHPFLFVIREDTKGILLFIGQLLNPLA